ncbi:lebercilin-like isoform X1 [Sinocyclocheilus grahami]|uniref:Lebercilin LCA5 n=2 Tax=Sinocyclocheilus grahami TaxID=75366 RepID=A0A672NE31_SINGR|nr:PREDICTED: lebercilin-like isoform X1 [Sinocyclocheilus grahami]
MARSWLNLHGDGDQKDIRILQVRGQKEEDLAVALQKGRDMDLHEDNRESEHSRLSHHSDGKISESPFQSEKQEKYKKNIKSSAGDHVRIRTREPARDPDRDRCSDGERSSASFYSDDYENVSHSARSLSPSAVSLSPQRRGRSRRVSSSPLHRAGVRKVVSHRHPPLSHHPQQWSRGIRSQTLSKDAPSKEVDPVTKRMLSARLLKINELKNALSELRLHADELQRENRLLRQMQLRQEKALHHYNDTESEISQLLSLHNNETHVLRERLRRSQENQRTAERSLRETDAQLQHCRRQLQKLQQLADDQNLGEREELSRKLTYTQGKLQESEHRVKELEKNMELSSGSFQRQLANERRRTHNAQQEVKALQEEVDKLCTKLKEKEKELDARNIYANRMLKASSRKEAENGSKRKGSNTTSTKAVQTEDRTSSLDFPSPPPTLTNELPPDDQTDDYLSLKQDQQGREQRPRGAKEKDMESEMEQTREKKREKEMLHDRKRDMELLKDKERQRLDQQHSSNEKNSKGNRGLDREEEDWRIGLSISQSEEESRRQREQEEEQLKARNVEIQAGNQECPEEEHQRKEQLLAKMREIDMQTQGQDSDFFSDDTGSVRSPPRLSEQRNHNGIFKFTEPEENTNTFASGRRVGGLRAHGPSEDLDLAFGSYAPSFGKSAPRAGLGARNANQSPRELDQELDLGGLVKERKSKLMQQLFGASATPPPSDPSSRMEILSPPLTSQFPSVPGGGRRRDTDTPNGLNISSLPNNRSTLHVSESRPVVRAITSFDDDIEEVTL